MGYPIKLIELNITDEIRNIIINVIKSPEINSSKLLTNFFFLKREMIISSSILILTIY